MFTQSCVVLENRQQITVAAGSHSQPLEQGIYDVWAATDAFIKVGMTANDVTSSTGYLVPGGKGIISVRIMQNGMRIGSTATLSIHQVE